MADAMSLLGGGQGGFSGRERAGMVLGAMSGRDQEPYRQRRKQEMQQAIMGESFSVLQDVDSGNTQGAIERVGRISMDLAKQGIDNSSFLDLGETLATDPKAGRQMLLDSARSAAASGTLDLRTNPMWASKLMGKKEKDVTFKPVMDDEGLPYEVRSFTDVDGNVKTVARDGTDLTGLKLHGPQSEFFMQRIDDMEKKPVGPLSPAGKAAIDLGETYGTLEFQAKTQELLDSGSVPKEETERERLSGLYDALEKSAAFVHYNEDYLDSQKVMQALTNAQYVPGKGVLGQRGASELYNADTRAASEIERLIISRGLAQSLEDWWAKVTTGTIGQETWESYVAIATEVEENSYRDRGQNLLLSTRSYKADFQEYKDVMRRYNYPVNLNEEEWEQFLNE